MFLALVLASNFSIVYRHALDIYFILYIFFFIIAKCLAILKILSSKLLTQQHIIQLVKKFIFCSKPHFVHYSIYQIYILNCKKTLYSTCTTSVKTQQICLSVKSFFQNISMFSIQEELNHSTATFKILTVDGIIETALLFMF